MRLTRARITTILVAASALYPGHRAFGDDPPPIRPATILESLSFQSLERTVAEITAGTRDGRGPRAFVGPPLRGEIDELDVAGRAADWSQGLEVVASVDREEFRQLQRIRVACKLKNLSGRHLWMRTGDGNLDSMIRIRVYDGRGKLVPRTEFARNEALRSNAISGGSPQLAINPGDSRQVDLVPNLIYDMTRPGEYWIVVEVPFFASSRLEGNSLQGRAEAIKVRVVPESLGVIDGRITVAEPDRP